VLAFPKDCPKENTGLWRLKRENGRDARWMLDDARHLVIDSLGIAGIVNDSGEDSGFAHILRLREVAPA
jgi:hypothetical protein